MANPYKDAAGHWTTKENDGGPCKHSDKQHQTRISGGKYQMRLNPESDWEDVETREEWEELRASSGDYNMDENVDDDFGAFDDETDKQEFINQLVEDGYFEEGEIKDIKFNDDDDGTIDITTDEGTQKYEYAGGRLYTHEEPEEEWDDDQEEDEGPDEGSSPYNEVDYNKVNDIIDDNIDDKDFNYTEKELFERVKDYFTHEGGDINPEDEQEIKKIIKERFTAKDNPSSNDDSMNPDNPKYKGFKRSDITNAKLVEEGKTVKDADTGKEEKLSIIEYIPYGALQDGDNRKLYGVVRNYDGSDAPKIGAMVSPDLESAKEDLQNQIELSEQGSERYLKRGKWDEEFFNMINDKEYDFDEETKNKYSKKYGWDFSKPWEEQEHVKGKK